MKYKFFNTIFTYCIALHMRGKRKYKQILIGFWFVGCFVETIELVAFKLVSRWQISHRKINKEKCLRVYVLFNVKVNDFFTVVNLLNFHTYCQVNMNTSTNLLIILTNKLSLSIVCWKKYIYINIYIPMHTYAYIYTYL